ncbi:MAG: phenylalanine--tRNA ligase subunit beta, partial [Silvibacterium sp.]
RQPVARELSRYQPVRRDFSLVFPDSVAYATIEDALRALGIAELRSFTAKEILRGTKGKVVPAGHFSLLLGTVFQSQERTLRDEELQEFSQKIIATMAAIGGRLRAS